MLDDSSASQNKGLLSSSVILRHMEEVEVSL
jgi:hypothetical protein